MIVTIIVLPISSCDNKLTSTSDVMLDVMSPSSSPVVAMVTISMQFSSVSMVVSDSVSTGIIIILKSNVHPTLRPIFYLFY